MFNLFLDKLAIIANYLRYVTMYLGKDKGFYPIGTNLA